MCKHDVIHEIHDIPEVHGISQRHKRKTEPWSCAENSANLERVVSEICMRTDRQTYLLIATPRFPIESEVTTGISNTSFIVSFEHLRIGLIE